MPRLNFLSAAHSHGNRAAKRQSYFQGGARPRAGVGAGAPLLHPDTPDGEIIPTELIPQKQNAQIKMRPLR